MSEHDNSNLGEPDERLVSVRSVASMARRLAQAALRAAEGLTLDSVRQSAVSDAQAALVLVEEAERLASEGDATMSLAFADEATSMAKAALATLRSTEPAEPAATSEAVPATWRAAIPPVAEPELTPVGAATPAPAPAPVLPAPADAAPAPADAATPEPLVIPKTKRPKTAKVVCATLAAVLVAVAALVGAAWWGLFDLPEPLQSRIELFPDPHAQQGRLNAATVEVEPGSFQMVLNQVTTMEAGSRTLAIAFENPAANAYSARLELMLNGQRVASTGMVLPGSYVETVQLDYPFDQGEHKLMAQVMVYSGATQVNTLSADVSVRVA